MAINKNPAGLPDQANPRVSRTQGDVRITNHDLVDDGDFVIPDDVSGLTNPPIIGGANWSVIGVESSQGNNFSIKFEYGTVDPNGNFTADFTYDKNDNGSLTGDSSYILSIRPVRDRVKITITDESGAANNDITGGVNSN